MIHRRSGFTLIEVMLAVAIAVVLIFMAMPSFKGLSAEKKLTASFERFDNLARKAQKNAVQQQRSWTMVWEAQGKQSTITLRADDTAHGRRVGKHMSGDDDERHLQGERNQIPETVSPSIDDVRHRRRRCGKRGEDDNNRREERKDERVGDPAFGPRGEREREARDRSRPLHGALP